MVSPRRSLPIAQELPPTLVGTMYSWWKKIARVAARSFPRLRG